MGRSLRDFRNSKEFIAFFTNRTIRGLPFHSDWLMTSILLGIIAKCQEKHPVKICHMLWMSNHFHMIICGPAKHISKFFSQMQSEIAKYLKSISSLYPEKVWESRYHMQRLGTAGDVIEKIAYLYLNPVKAGLVSTVAEWQGVSTYNNYISGSNVIESKHIGVRNFKHINTSMFYEREVEQRKYFKDLPGTYHRLTISPNDWKYCFAEYCDKTDEEIFKEINGEIKRLEAQYAFEHKDNFMGKAALKAQSISKAYVPKAKTETPVIICRDTNKRIEMILDYKKFCNDCREYHKAWKCGNVVKAKYPYGAYRPGMPILSRLKLTN